MPKHPDPAIEAAITAEEERIRKARQVPGVQPLSTLAAKIQRRVYAKPKGPGRHKGYNGHHDGGRPTGLGSRLALGTMLLNMGGDG